jgi:hypothetical protein
MAKKKPGKPEDREATLAMAVSMFMSRHVVARVPPKGDRSLLEEAELSVVYLPDGRNMKFRDPLFASYLQQETGLKPKFYFDDLKRLLRQHAIDVRISVLSARGDSGDYLVHLGHGAVARLTAGGKWVPDRNPCDGVLFKEELNFEPLSAEKLCSYDPIGAHLFPVLHRVFLDRLPPPMEGSPLSEREHKALALAGWLTIFALPFAPQRPVFLALGEPGCGKTTTQQLKSKLYLGPKGNTGASMQNDRFTKDLIALLANRAFVARDDITHLKPDQVNTMCQMATGSVGEGSKFFEDCAIGEYDVFGVLDVSACRPEWLKRADLISRLIISQYGTPPKTELDQNTRITDVAVARPDVWGETFMAVLPWSRTSPKRESISRFDSWEQAVAPIVAAAGYGEELDSALRKMRQIGGQVAIESSPELALIVAAAQRVNGVPLLAAEWADKIAEVAGVRAGDHDTHIAKGIVFQPDNLGRYLGRLQRDGSAAVKVTRIGDPHKGVKWKIEILVNQGVSTPSEYPLFDYSECVNAPDLLTTVNTQKVAGDETVLDLTPGVTANSALEQGKEETLRDGSQKSEFSLPLLPSLPSLPEYGGVGVKTGSLLSVSLNKIYDHAGEGSDFHSHSPLFDQNAIEGDFHSPDSPLSPRTASISERAPTCPVCGSETCTNPHLA